MNCFTISSLHVSPGIEFRGVWRWDSPEPNFKLVMGQKWKPPFGSEYKTQVEVCLRDVPVCIARRAETYLLREVRSIHTDYQRKYFAVYNGPRATIGITGLSLSSMSNDCLVRVNTADTTFTNPDCPGGGWEVLEGNVRIVTYGLGVSTLRGRIIPDGDRRNGWTTWVDALAVVAPGAKIRVRWGNLKVATFINNDGAMENEDTYK